MYVLYKLEYAYISKHKRVHKSICMRQVAQGCMCITISLDKIDIYMKFKHKHLKHVQNENTSQNV